MKFFALYIGGAALCQSADLGFWVSAVMGGFLAWALSE